MRRLVVFVFSALLLATALTGCGGSGSSGALDGLSAEQILTQASAKTSDQTSYRVALTAKVDADADRGTIGGQLGAVLTQPLDISGEGTVQKPGDISFDLSTEIATSPIQINVTKVDDGLYVSVLGQAFAVDLPKGAAASVDLRGLPSSVAGWMKDPTVVGNEDLNGVPTVHIRGGVDTAVLTKDLGTLASTIGSPGAVGAATEAQTEKALKKGVVDVWIGTDDTLIYGADADIGLEGQVDAVKGLNALGLVVSIRLSDFGTTQTIIAPANARTLDLNDVGSILGG